MTINERITEIRKDAGLTKGKFGASIGLKQSQAGFIEKTGTVITDRVVQLICTEFNVSEDWLRYGVGEKYTQNADAIIRQLSKEYELDSDYEALIREMLKLKPEHQELVVDFLIGFANNILETREKEKAEAEARRKAQEEAKKTKAAAHPDIIRPDNVTDEQWETMLAALEASELEKSTQESPASISGSSATQKEA